MRLLRILGLTVAAIGWTPAVARATPETWVVEHDEAGRQVWRRDESALNTSTTLRTHEILPAPIAQIMAVLWDSDSRCEWVEGCRESRVLARPDKLVTLQYTRSSAGAMVPDRDVVLENHLLLQPVEGLARLTFKSVENQQTPLQRYVIRMPKLEGFFLLKRIDQQHTEVTYQATMDPGGGMPSFMMRAPMVSKVVEMLQGLLARLGRGAGNAVSALRGVDLSGFNNATAPQ